MRPVRLLFIDAYDSFSNNIIQLVKDSIPRVQVETIKIDESRFVLNEEAFFHFLDGFDAVIAGPGPGHPANQKDVGLIAKLWALPQKHVIPVLGICLGFQSLAYACGARIERLNEPRHGLVTKVTHSGVSLYYGTGEVLATQYHSLHARLSTSDSLAGDVETLWSPRSDLEPLAWDLDDHRNGPILMAARHVSKPFHGVQYHAESVCTNDEGRKCILVWWCEAAQWNEKNHRTTTPCKTRSSTPPVTNGIPTPETARAVHWTSLSMTDGLLDAVNLIERFRSDGVECVLLESGTRSGQPLQPETGRFSIIGLYDVASLQVRYYSSSHTLEVSADGETVRHDADIGNAFSHLKKIVAKKRCLDGPRSSPFWGGLVGFVSYEAGLEVINVASPKQSDWSRPDLWFIMVERSLVVDHVENKVYIQSTQESDSRWIGSASKNIADMLKMRSTRIVSQISQGRCLLCDPAHAHFPADKDILSHAKERHGIQTSVRTTGPDRHTYCATVRYCQSYIRAGSSYELCLTDQTLVSVPQARINPWELYKRLRSLNPAPFSAYLRFRGPDAAAGRGVSIASSSPERFLSWSRSGVCQYRPIKGTVKKDAGMTRAEAEKILGSAKERAENLMIVDLIRHDLHGVEGIKDVAVKQLMSVEEYETVYQLVSVIEGHVDGTSASGIDILASSLPPGSMTGAPKKRSCELLQELEHGKPRGIYSGVLGYMDVGGGGDFSVAIRTAFKWDEEHAWHIGAGGAVTALSDAGAEWEEMLAKRDSVLRAFAL